MTKFLIWLTCGLCWLAPAPAIRGGATPVDPKRDQHVAHELNRLGNPVGQRLAAAADCLVEDEDMLEIVRWVAANTPLDWLYVYGPHRAIHVSQRPEQSRQVVAMRDERGPAYS